MDLPLITEATNDYYRSIYADPLLGPIFRGVNMVVLRQHVSYFIHQVTMFDAPMTERQLDYLRKVHKPVIARHNVSQTHYDLMLGHLVEAMRTNGAQEHHLDMVQAKMQPLRDMFPPPNAISDTPADGTVVLRHPQCPFPHMHQGQQQQQQQLSLYAGHPGQAGSVDTDGSSMQCGSSICTDYEHKEQQQACSAKPKVKAWAKRMLRSLRGKNTA
ncbi:hypothetical protein OEZ85_010355 [Tetradesmus obliquus]|uniref:Globin family profile domain-containing protein n=1 Tax=Tetradesmus obliquus TaxID=3088 RepID=A0ABY8TM47_TETOB|nr:hypothetical protein OEZ85_010355 [Tetradesmus obliquus]